MNPSLFSGSRSFFSVMKSTTKLFSVLTLFGALASAVQAQTIVNTETLLLDAEKSFQWTSGIAGDFSHGNSNVVDLSIDGGAAWTSGAWTIKAAAAWARLAESGNAIQANAFGQIRMTVGDASKIQPYAFVQTSQNNVLLLSSRNLVGAGVKRRLIDGEVGYLATSIGAFYEDEIYTSETGEPSKQLLRNSLIVSAGWDVSEDVLFRLTSYIQSAYTDWNDSRIFVEWGLDLGLSENVAIEWSAGFRWDGDPHGGLGNWDLGNTVGLRLGLDQ